MLTAEAQKTQRRRGLQGMWGWGIVEGIEAVVREN
jgi:hypothetical protein